MNLPIKIIAAIVLLVWALIGGLYLSGWLTLLLLSLRDQVMLDWNTYGQYWQVLDLPQVAPYATRIEIAGGVGFGLPLLLWLGLLAWLLLKCPSWSLHDTAGLAGVASTPLHQTGQEPVNGGTVPDAPTPGALYAQQVRREMERIDAQPLREPGTAAASAALNPTESDEMNFRQLAATAALGVAAVTVPALGGCGQKDYGKVQFQHNPHPVERYEITVKVEGAPGPFKWVKGGSTYDIYTPCLPPDDPYTGAQLAPSAAAISMELTSTGANTWSGTMYADGMLDAPYYDRGTCRWRLRGVGVHMKASGAAGETDFISELDADEVRGGKTVVTYFNKINSSYPRDNVIENFRYFGETKRSSYGPGITDADLFIVTLSARKVTP
jgi:hypothetical protein